MSDATLGEADQTRLDRPGRILLAATVARCAIFMEITIVGVALPTMVQDLDISTATASWTVTIYTLALAATVVPLGRLGDRIGHRRMLVLALIALAVTSLLCALAPTFPALLVARVLQGAAAAALMPSTQAVVAQAYPPAERTRALGIMVGFQGLLFAAGPVIGGLAISGAGWRWVFAVVTPLALIGLVLVVLFIPTTPRDEDAPSLAVASSLLLAASASAIVMAGVQLGAQGRQSALLWSLIGAGLAWLFVRVDRRATDRLLNPDLMRRRRFQAGLVGGFFYQFGLLAMSVIMLSYFQVGLEMSPQTAGLAFLPLCVPILASGQVAPLVARFGAGRVLVAGLGVLSVSILITSVLALERDYAVLVPALVLVGIGITLTATPVQTVTTAELPQAIAGLAGGVLSLVRQIGGAVGVAFLTTVAAVTEQRRITSLDAGLSASDAADLQSLVAGRPSAQQALASLPEATRALVEGDAVQTLAVATCVSLLVGGILFLMGTTMVSRLLGEGPAKSASAEG